jgi:hypothetical protein
MEMNHKLGPIVLQLLQLQFEVVGTSNLSHLYTL